MKSNKGVNSVYFWLTFYSYSTSILLFGRPLEPRVFRHSRDPKEKQSKSDLNIDFFGRRTFVVISYLCRGFFNFLRFVFGVKDWFYSVFPVGRMVLSYEILLLTRWDRFVVSFLSLGLRWERSFLTHPWDLQMVLHCSVELWERLHFSLFWLILRSWGRSLWKEEGTVLQFLLEHYFVEMRKGDLTIVSSGSPLSPVSGSESSFLQWEGVTVTSRVPLVITSWGQGGWSHHSRLRTTPRSSSVFPWNEGVHCCLRFTL